MLGFVLASPLIALGLQRRSLLAPRGSSVGVREAIVLPVATLSVAAGLIHLGVIPAHFREDRLTGLFFVVAAAFQISWGVFFARHSVTRLAWVGLIANAAIVGLWVASRTTGLPFGAHPGISEPIGIADTLASGFELLLVVACACLVTSSARAALQRSQHPVESADLALAMALVAITLVASYAMTDVAITGGHHAVSPAEAQVTQALP